MKIKYIHSHLNGHEFLLVHHADIWDEVQQVIADINAEDFITKKSREVRKAGQLLYSPRELNAAFVKGFREADWKSHIQTYYLTPDEGLAYQTMSLLPQEQKRIIEEHGETAFYSYNQTDFLKNRIAIEVQFGKYAFVAYDLFVKHMAFYIANQIDVGIEIIPTKNMCTNMSSGIAYYEGEVYNVYRQGRSTTAVPLVLLGVEP